MAVWLGVLWLVAGAVMAAVGWLGANGKLRRNHWAGIRLPSTMASDDAWAAGHADGSRWLAGGGGLVATIGVLMLLFKPDDATVAAISIVLAFFMVVIIAGAATAAHGAAKKATAQAQQP
ncbi:MAG: SdpI family protein [Actinomycetes bacterium]